MEVRDVQIPARDGRPLAGTLFLPARANGDAVAVAAAMGVQRRFYRRFAAHLAERGFTCATFDYRGIGGSADGPVRRSGDTLAAWGELDLPGVYDWLAETARARRLLHVGHSVGGQLLGLLPPGEAARLGAVVAVAAQSGYWRLWPAPMRWGVWGVAHVLVPAAGRALGYVPGWSYGGGEPLPNGVGLEWARWLRSPGYLHVRGPAVAEAFQAMRAPTRAYSFTDDRIAPAHAVEVLLGWLGGPTEHVRAAPADVGARHIGHFGYFRAACSALWDATADWLAATRAG